MCKHSLKQVNLSPSTLQMLGTGQDSIGTQEAQRGSQELLGQSCLSGGLSWPVQLRARSLRPCWVVSLHLPSLSFVCYFLKILFVCFRGRESVRRGGGSRLWAERGAWHGARSHDPEPTTRAETVRPLTNWATPVPLHFFLFFIGFETHKKSLYLFCTLHFQSAFIFVCMLTFSSFLGVPLQLCVSGNHCPSAWRNLFNTALSDVRQVLFVWKLYYFTFVFEGIFLSEFKF